MGGRAARHGPVRVRVVQYPQGGTAPLAQLFGQALHQRMGMEHAAVEQQGVGQFARRMLGQEQRQMARNGRVRRVGQA